MSTEKAQQPNPDLRVAQVQTEVGFGVAGIELKTFNDAWKFCTAVAKSQLVPRGLDTPEKVLVAVQTGMEAGLSPMASVRAVYVVGGVPSWRGDAALALVRASGKMSAFQKLYEGKPFEDDFQCVVTMERGKEQITSEFSVADAKAAALWGKKTKQGGPTPWVLYPKRMLYYRALGFAIRDLFPDITMNMHLAEELEGHEELASAGLSVSIDRSNEFPEGGDEQPQDGLFAKVAGGDVVQIDPKAAGEPDDKDTATDPPADGEIVDAEFKEEEPTEPPPPLEPYSWPAAKTLGTLAECLSHIEHRTHGKTVKKWSKPQRAAAWEWAHSYARWYDMLNGAVDASFEEFTAAKEAIPARPQFIPENGEMGDVPIYRHTYIPPEDEVVDGEPGGESEEEDPDEWDSFCQKPLGGGESGEVCTLPKGHGGDCE